jgi:large subunit ribosomal protein L10
MDAFKHRLMVRPASRERFSPTGAEPVCLEKEVYIMPNAQKTEALSAIKEDLKDITAMWVVDYRGLSVKEAQDLRRSIRKSGAHMTVYKNTLMRIALKDAGLPEVDDMLAGPNAFVFAKDDAAAAAKAVNDFAKDNEKLVIKGGYMEGEVVDAETVKAIASLPSREELMGKMAGLISGIARGLAVSINGVPRGLAQSIDQVAKQKPAA